MTETIINVASLTSATVIASFWILAVIADRIAVRREVARQPKREVVFLMGNPAAGKSTVATRRFAATHKFIDCDQFKAAHPDYDPKNPSALHAWSAQQADLMFKNVCTGGQGTWVLDGTGANLGALLEDIAIAKEAGFTVSLFYVKCSLETSLRRNARRERVVPEEIVRQKASAIESSFAVAQAYVHNVMVVDNDAEMVF